jgi:P63C domain
MLSAMQKRTKAAAEIGALGGKARADKLSKGQRADIARSAAAARWAGQTPRATHSGELKLGEAQIPCAVLEDGTRVLTQVEMMNALGRNPRPMGARGTGFEHVPSILRGKAINPFIPEDLLDSSRPIKFITPTGSAALGFRAEILPKVCDVYLRAREAGELPPNQQHIAAKAEILVRALAHVGIVALVDEATGFQDARARDALAKILEDFVAKELRKWVSTFPPEYYKELFRLRNWRFPDIPRDQQKRPVMAGKITNDIVYARLAPGVRAELHRVTPRDEKGRLKHKLFQRLTENVGHPKLREHLAKVVTVMQLSQDWPTFMQNMNRLMPKYMDLPLFDDLPAVEEDVTPAL